MPVWPPCIGSSWNVNSYASFSLSLFNNRVTGLSSATLKDCTFLLPNILKDSIEIVSKMFSLGATLSWLILSIPAYFSSFWKNWPKSRILLLYISLTSILATTFFPCFSKHSESDIRKVTTFRTSSFTMTRIRWAEKLYLEFAHENLFFLFLLLRRNFSVYFGFW